MSIHGPRLSRRSLLLLGVLSLAGTYACADRVEAPHPSTPQLDLEASGVYVSTLWRPTDSGAAYLGGVTGRVEVRGTGAAMRVTTADEHALSAAPRAPAPLADRDGAGSLSRFVTARTIDLPSKNGKRLQLLLATDPRNDGRPAMAAVIVEDHRPVAVSEYSYARDVKGWRVVRSRTTMLDAAGKAKLVVDNDLSQVLGGAGRSARADAVAATTAADLYEDDTDDGPEIRCAAERLIVASATAGWIAAASGLAALATTACTASPASCAWAIAAAQAALAVADIALGTAIGNLQRCLNPPPPPPPQPTYTPGYSPSPGPGYVQWCDYLVTYDEDGYAVSATPIRCWWTKDE